MKIIVLVKQTFDTEAKITLDEKGQICDKDVNRITNPYDEFALEEAVRIKEKNGAEVVAITLGHEEGEKVLRNALALGADRAIHIHCDLDGLADSRMTAHYLSQVIQREEADFNLILAGWVAVDNNAALVPGFISEFLQVPLANVVTKLQLKDEKIECEREGDGLSEIISLKLPALVTVQKGINEPRYPTMKNIMAAKKKPIKIINLTELQEMESSTLVKKFYLPVSKGAGKIVVDEGGNSVGELMAFFMEKKFI